MKKFLISLFAVSNQFMVLAQPVPHAVLDGRGQISGYENLDAGLIDSYRADPNKANKVEKYRLLVVPAKPSATLQEIVEPAGTNINDGGFTLTASNVTQVWLVRALTPQEIAERNTATAIQVSEVLDDLVRTNNWEQRHLRMVYLQSEMLFYLTRALVIANIHTNLTPQQRSRANSVSNELVELYNLRQYGRTNYFFALTNSVVVLPPTNWPGTVIDE